jgi:ketosteroid isomerase-like protein
MLPKLSFSTLVILLIAISTSAQNTNSAAVRQRSAGTNNSNQQRANQTRNTTISQQPTATKNSQEKKQEPAKSSEQKPSPTAGVLAAFDTIIDGIKHANVEQVASGYWKSTQLILFNGNGTVTKGWEQMRANRASSYPEIKDVKLEVKDLHIQMLGTDGAVVTCLWSQSQTYKSVPESASGRMTLVFRKAGGAWKAVHLHTSPDAPDSSRVLPSEQTPSATPKPTP